MSKQLGFVVDLDRCIGCNACRVSCQTNNRTSSAVHWRQVDIVRSGVFPPCRGTCVRDRCKLGQVLGDMV